MTLLEQRYRFALRMLPASYRAEREDEMVDAFLDGAGQVRDEDNARPSWREIASVAALAVRVRVGGLGAAPRYRVMGDAVRLAALLGLGFHAVSGWEGIPLTLRALGLLGSIPEEWLTTGFAGQVWAVVAIAMDGVWIAAFAALALGRARAAKILATLGLLYTLAMLARDAFTDPVMIFDNVPHVLATAVPVVALLTGYHADAPPARRRPLAALLPMGVAMVCLVIEFATGQRLLLGGDTMGWVYGWASLSGMTTAALLLTGLLCLTRNTSSASRLALAIAAVPLILAGTPSMFQNAADPVTQALHTTAIIQNVALLALCLALVTAGVRSLPRPA